MWQMLSFDLPADTSEKRKAYRMLRRQVLAEGFTMFHESLYYRWFETEEKARAVLIFLQKTVPKEGNLAFWNLTDGQFDKICFFQDGKAIPPPSPPNPFAMF